MLQQRKAFTRGYTEVDRGKSLWASVVGGLPLVTTEQGTSNPPQFRESCAFYIQCRAPEHLAAEDAHPQSS